ncbi:hypothetical protein PIB30_080626 [Stylosanthes scabra]|uniref:Uncharacterized protein n=1 Tax=Stylosanthes scabra TaxID=79078 RepID=A0ABU6TR14_9FABA|nr:hypothetical protein [Stylosanthes scabra]
MNISYYDEKAMRRITAGIGNPIKVDGTTKEAEREKFAIACDEIDLEECDRKERIGVGDPFENNSNLGINSNPQFIFCNNNEINLGNKGDSKLTDRLHENPTTHANELPVMNNNDESMGWLKVANRRGKEKRGSREPLSVSDSAGPNATKLILKKTQPSTSLQ